MKLISLTVGRFGKHENLHMDFSGGLDSFCFPNGWGKSTLLAFLKAMFYGFVNDRAKDVVENDRKHYMPWGSESSQGQIVYEVSGKVYRLERTFTQKASSDTAHLFDEATGSEIPCPSCLGEELFRIDADGFERTVFLSESWLRGKNENKSVAARFADLSGVEGDMGSVDDAIVKLEKERKNLFKSGGHGLIGDLTARQTQLRCDLSALQEEMKNLGALEHELDSKTAQKEEKQKQLLSLEEEYKKLPPKDKRQQLQTEIEREKARTEQNRRTLQNAKAFLGEDAPTLEDIRKIEEIARQSQEAKAKADALSKSDEKGENLPAAFLSVTEEKLTKMKENAEVSKNLPLLLLLGNLASLGVFFAIFLPFCKPLFAIIGVIAALAVAAVFYYLVLSKRFTAKKALDAFLSSLSEGNEKRKTLAEAESAYRAYQTAKDTAKAQNEEIAKYESVALCKEAEKNAFLSKFPIAKDDLYPLDTVRQHILEVSALTATVAESDKHIAVLSAEASSDVFVLAERIYADLDQKREVLTSEIAALSKELTVLSTKIDAFDDLQNRKEAAEVALVDLETEIEQKNKDLDVNYKTQNYLKAAADKLTAMYIGPTKKAFSDLMREVDGEGIYNLTTSFEISKQECAITHKAEEYSRGMRDLYDFVLRLSLNDALYTDEKPFLLLDDPFLALDDAHFGKAAKILKVLSKTYQILYFTCTEKRKIG